MPGKGPHSHSYKPEKMQYQSQYILRSHRSHLSSDPGIMSDSSAPRSKPRQGSLRHLPVKTRKKWLKLG